ncbi:hypothetical protein JW933_09745 [candidate division FCPU426 bacterium]|nr:hypothetical protein [candidate division FCPU426 bacterium]
MRKSLFFILSCMVLTGMIFMTGCSQSKSLNPVAPEPQQEYAAQSFLHKTLTWSGPYDTVKVTYLFGLIIKKAEHTGFRSTHVIYADTKSTLTNTYPAHGNSAQRDLTCPSRPGEVLTIGFTAGQLSYIVQKRPGLDIFCHYIDSYYQIYDGSYTHRITEYPLP